MKKFLIFLSALIVSCTSSNDYPPVQPVVKPTLGKGIKGVWVTNVASPALSSAANIKETVRVCKESGITDIFTVVWNKGRTLYPSTVMNTEFGKPIMEGYEGRDPLQEMITEAHKEGIKVHAWFEYGFAASNFLLISSLNSARSASLYRTNGSLDFDGSCLCSSDLYSG